jgi:putative ABC transport system substrate-binding protein
MGYVEGQNLVFVERYAEGKADRLPALAAELVERHVHVIVVGDTPAIRAAIQATTTIPIVMATVADPVERGFVQSLARPGGNVTGVGGLVQEVSEKLLELLKEAVPSMRQVAVFTSPQGRAPQSRELETAAHARGVQLQFLKVQGPDAIERVFATATREGADALLLLPNLLFGMDERRIAALALQYRLPAIFWRRDFAEAGGLMAYGPRMPDLWRRAAALVGKILNGAKPADLPVEQPMTFELVINLKTAKALGLTIPPTLLYQADEVIK